MESGILSETCKGIKSVEEYKEMWMSLFDMSVISSCSGKDPDLFYASALLKTAFHIFIKLKRRLLETEKLIERFVPDEWEGKFGKSNSFRSSAVCVRCEDQVEDIKQSPRKKSSTLQHVIECTDNTYPKKSISHSKDISYSPKQLVSTKKDNCNPDTELPKGAGSKINFMRTESMKDVDTGNVNNILPNPTIKLSSSVTKSKFSICNDEHVVDKTHSEILSDCTSPCKRWSQCKSKDISPILKQCKKPRQSTALSIDALKCRKALDQSLSPSQCEISSILCKSVLKKSNHGKVLTTGCNKSPESMELNVENMYKESNGKLEEKSPDVHNNSDNEEVEIILPSPVSFKDMGYCYGKGYLYEDETEEEDMKSKTKKLQKCVNIISLPDTDMTYFLPIEEKKSEISKVDSILLENEGFIHEKDDCKGKRVLCATFSNSFDQVPSFSDSPSYRHRRETVRKKKERKKLFGWECKDCQKYYEAAGLSPEEKRDCLNRCSRHRHKFTPENNFPEGFWNPVFPETSQ